MKKTLSFYSSILLLTSLILFSSKSTAQIIDTLKRESNGSTVYTVAVSDTVSQKMENGIKIVGEKTFDIEINRGDVKEIIYTNVDGVGNCAYVVSENWIDRVNSNSSFDTVHVGTLRPKDGSKIFTHDEAIYISPDGTLFATTNTMILILKSKTEIQRKYADRCGDFPYLTHPIIREGNGSNVADIRDNEFVGYKIKVSKTGEMEMKEDKLEANFN